MKNKIREKLYYENCDVFGYNELFTILLGSRGVGKTFSTQNFCIRQWLKTKAPFVWLRLTEASTKKLLQNNAKDFIDSKLRDKWGLTEEFDVRGPIVYYQDEEFCRIMALSTFYSSKGVALNKNNEVQTRSRKSTEKEAADKISRNLGAFKTIVLDEMNREKNEKNTFDIGYAFVNQLENLCRLDTEKKIILLGNTLDEASDILVGCFNFIPEKFGTYRLHKKRAVIQYMDDSQIYKEKRAKSIAGLLASNESTFTNIIKSDIDLLHHGHIGVPSYIITFDGKDQFVVHGDVITLKKLPKNHRYNIIAMRPYLTGLSYNKEMVNTIIELTQQRCFKFDKLFTLKKYYKEIKLLKEAK